MPPVKHPAVYTGVLIPMFHVLLYGRKKVLDPFAGTCKLGELKKLGFTGEIWCNELEEEWASMGEGVVDKVVVGDVLKMGWAKDGQFDAICTSPVYGNRMSDHHNARDGSSRTTYTHCIGRKLHDRNSGVLQWGPKYRKFHRKAWRECVRVLCDGGIFVLNISDHIRGGERMRVTRWHIKVLKKLGLKLEKRVKVKTPRNRKGANSKLRVGYESVCVFAK